MACLAVFVSAYTKAGSQITVLAVARSVPQGQILDAGDLTTVRVSASTGISMVPAGDAPDVVGRRAAELLQPQTLLSMNELVTSFSPPSGRSIVGVALKEGQLPASGVAPGETVEVILTGLPGAQDSSDPTGTGPAVPASGSAVAAGSISSAGAAGSDAGLVGTVLVPAATVLEVATSPSSSASGELDVSLLVPPSLAPFVASASVAGQVALVVVTPPS